MADQDPDDLLDRLFKLIHRSSDDDMPSSDAPDDFSRHVEITDIDADMHRIHMQDLMLRGRRIFDQLRLHRADMDAARARMYVRLGDAYPSIGDRHECHGVGIRQWKGKWHYVAWDHVPKDKKGNIGLPEDDVPPDDRAPNS